jgi:hypothetical protein
VYDDDGDLLDVKEDDPILSTIGSMSSHSFIYT